MSDIELDNKLHLERFKNEPPHPSYISGFIDGDGCIFIRKITDGYQSGISIAQCRTNILQIIRYHFGGSITTSTNRNNKIDIMTIDGLYDKHNIRNEYNLIIRNNEYNVILEYIRHSMIIKTAQMETLYNFNKIANLVNQNEEKNKLYEICKNNNIQTHVETRYLGRLNIQYIQGLFDAEGCFFINKNNYNNMYISISQKNHPIILEQIQVFLGYGRVYKEDFIITKKIDCIHFIQLIKNGLIVKYNQALAFETLLNTKNIDEKIKLYELCNKEKHQIELFLNINQNDTGKEMYDKIVFYKNIKSNICKEIHRIQVYKDKSIKMTGKGNHNFGKPKSDETKKKLSDSIRYAKGGVSDEIINRVRELIQSGKTNMEIQDILSLPRHTVSRIKNGNIVCRNETKDIKTTTHIERNINKRKITANEILITMDKIFNDDKPMVILKTLVQNRENSNIPNTLTIDIIKNIKRSITNGELPIYNCEVNETIYNAYMERVIEYNKKQIQIIT
jgi:hypothetical protein